MHRESFVFKKSWLLAIEGYASNVRCEFYEAVFEYLSCGRTVDLVSGGAKRAFASVKRDIDSGNADVDDTPQTPSDSLDNNINNNKNINQKKEKETQKKENEKASLSRPSLEMISPRPSLAAGVEPETVDVKAFIEYFNETLRKAGAVIPHSCTVTQKRATALKARCREHGKGSLRDMTEKAAQSDFLNGRNNKGWVASLDWLLRPNNFVKAIEGNYDNDKPGSNKTSNTICKSSNYGNTDKKTIIDPRRGTDASDIPVEEYEKGF